MDCGNEWNRCWHFYYQNDVEFYIIPYLSHLNYTTPTKRSFWITTLTNSFHGIHPKLLLTTIIESIYPHIWHLFIAQCIHLLDVKTFLALFGSKVIDDGHLVDLMVAYQKFWFRIDVSECVCMWEWCWTLGFKSPTLNDTNDRVKFSTKFTELY